MIKKTFTNGNLWYKESSGVNGNSNIVDTGRSPFLSIHGTIGDATTLSFWVSTDAINFYYCGQISTLITPTTPPGAPAESYPRHFHTYVQIGARYIRLQSTNDVEITATCEVKPS